MYENDKEDFLLIDSCNIGRMKSDCEIILAKDIFDKNFIPQEHQNIIIKTNGPLLTNISESEEYLTGLPFNFKNLKIEMLNDKTILSSSTPYITDNDRFIFSNNLDLISNDAANQFLINLNNSGYFRTYLESLKEFLNIYFDLDYMNELFEKENNPSRSLKKYREYK